MFFIGTCTEIVHWNIPGGGNRHKPTVSALTTLTAKHSSTSSGVPPAPPLDSLVVDYCQPAALSHKAFPPQNLCNPYNYTIDRIALTSCQDVNQVSFEILTPGKGEQEVKESTNLRSRVRTLTGKEIELDIENDYKVMYYSVLCLFSTEIMSQRWRRDLGVHLADTISKVSQIKEKVEEKEGIPPAQQRLIYGGKQMYVRCHEVRARSCYKRTG